MTSQSRSANTAPNARTHASPASHLREEYETWQRLFDTQPGAVERYLEGQARTLADAILQRQPQAKFTLPDAVVVDIDPASTAGKTVKVPADMREQMTGGLLDRITRTDIGLIIRERLAELEQSSDRAVAVSAGLLRHATATYMVRGMLPAGRSVTYVPDEGEETPTLPATTELEPQSAITASTDAIAEEGADDAGRGELLVPYVPYARKFYLPRWVAFDDQDRLLVASVAEAEAHVASMQRFIGVLHAAVSLAPYMVADDVYQSKRYGMLGQLINQGRALARYQTQEIVRIIKQRAGANDLNRGLSLSLPYFDDQDLVMKTHNFEVIPGGRIMFVPAFVVRASMLEQAKVAQDTRLSPSTRKHLLTELRLLEQAFNS